MAYRPPFILAFAADTQGCGFVRVMTPLASLVSAGVAQGRIDLGGWDDVTVLACNPDVIIWQRQVEDGQIATMQRWRTLLPKTLFIYELDDYLDEIPPASFHASFMPPDIHQRIKQALALCDRVTTSTRPLADWLVGLLPTGSQTGVMVVPNALPAARLQTRQSQARDKLRVGFCGGMSHSGDLELIKQAMAAIGDAVEWVFFGTQPDNPPVAIEYHAGVPPHMYMDVLASMGMDLMLAPLEVNKFNDCKSNLRLLESVVAGACVIAQDAVPYRENKPPVQYAGTPDSWIRAIRAFMACSPAERQRDAEALCLWANRHYSLERVLPARMEAWLPGYPGSYWQPQNTEPTVKTTVACRDKALTAVLREALRDMPVRFNEDGLENACRDALLLNTNVLWLRPGALFDARCLRVLRDALAHHPHSAAVVPLASDGWNAFPQLDQWIPLPQSVVDAVGTLVADMFDDAVLPVQTPAGPVSYLSLRALKTFGIPDPDGVDGNEEQAILEWGLLAAAREQPTVQAIGCFAGSVTAPVPATRTAVTRLQARGYGDLLKVKPERDLTSASRQDLEIALLRQQWGGPRPGSMGFDNTYESWSMLRKVQDALRAFDGDPQQAYAYSCIIHPIGEDSPSWSGDAWVIFVDDAIAMHGTALREFNTAVAQADKNVAVIYADHENIIGTQIMPEFKPGVLDQTLLMAQDYVTPICAIRNPQIDRLPMTRTALFEIVLRVLQTKGRTAFSHIPKVLATVTADAAPEAAALETVQRQNLINAMFAPELSVTAHPQILGCLAATWTTEQTPSVCIVIPTLGYGRLIGPCVSTILQHTDYAHYDILVVQNGEREQPELSAAILALPNIRVIRWDKPFNWAAVNNWAIKQTGHPYIVTLNDDVCVAGKNWLGDMLAHAVMPDVGAVGAKLVHPAGVIQHAGVVCHHGVAGHMHKGQPNGTPGHLGRALLSHEAAAVTGACMLFSRTSFDRVGGFNEDFAVNYNDTVFCLELGRLGLRNVVAMSAELLHPEASSRPASDTPDGMAVLTTDNMRLAKLYPEADPYWNANLQIQSSQGGLMLQGLNADMLAWHDFLPREGADRVLLINDLPGTEGRVLAVLRSGAVPFMADLSGFKLKLTAPAPSNVAAWDVRKVAVLTRDLQALGISRVVLRSLVGSGGAAPPVETLRALVLLRLSIAVEIDAIDAATMTPWTVEDYQQSNDDTVFGYADVTTWKSTYDSLVAQGE